MLKFSLKLWVKFQASLLKREEASFCQYTALVVILYPSILLYCHAWLKNIFIQIG